MNQKMKKYYDRGSRLLPELKVGDKVCFQNQTTVRTTRWDKTVVITHIKRPAVRGPCGWQPEADYQKQKALEEDPRSCGHRQT